MKLRSLLSTKLKVVIVRNTDMWQNLLDKDRRVETRKQENEVEPLLPYSSENLIFIFLFMLTEYPRLM